MVDSIKNLNNRINVQVKNENKVAITKALSEIGSKIFPKRLSQEYFLAKKPSKKSEIPAKKKKKREA